MFLVSNSFAALKFLRHQMILLIRIVCIGAESAILHCTELLKQFCLTRKLAYCHINRSTSNKEYIAFASVCFIIFGTKTGNCC